MLTVERNIPKKKNRWFSSEMKTVAENEPLLIIQNVNLAKCNHVGFGRGVADAKQNVTQRETARPGYYNIIAAFAGRRRVTKNKTECS